MGKFKDASGREWSFAITKRKITRLRTDCGLDLNEATAKDLSFFAQFLTVNAYKLGEAAWLLIGEESNIANLSRDDFDDAIDAAANRAIIYALAEEIVDFFLPLAAEQVKPRLTKLLGEAMGRAGLEMDRRIEALSGSNDSAASSPASPASIPTR